MTADPARLAGRITDLLRPPSPCVVIVATVDAEGGPHTAPFGSCLAVAADRLRFGCSRSHDTYDHVRGDGRVTIVVCAPPDIAVSIRGRASVVVESMSTDPDGAVIEVEIDEVKDDWRRGPVLRTGLTIEYPGAAGDYVARYLSEVAEAGRRRVEPPA